MLGYIEKNFHRLQHFSTLCKRNSPNQWRRPEYGYRILYAPYDDTTSEVDKHEKKSPESFWKKFVLCSGCILQHSHSTQNHRKIKIQTHRTYRRGYISSPWLHINTPQCCFYIKKARDIVLHVHSDAYYLSEPKAWIIVYGNSFLRSKSADPSKKTKNPTNNGQLHTKYEVLLYPVASSEEAKLGALFHNEQTTILLRTTLEDLGHQQPPTTT